MLLKEKQNEARDLQKLLKREKQHQLKTGTRENPEKVG